MIDKISIEKIENQIITKYDNRVINVSNVSNRYEIFDIGKYLKDKIELIEKNFTITKYDFRLTRGQQSLTLVSDGVEIGGVEFHKSFYILNSTDKSRRLSFNAGLKSDNFYTIGMNNVGLTKKHLTGVTQAAEDASVGLTGETFDEQIEALTSLVGHRIQFSKLRQIILGEKEERIERRSYWLVFTKEFPKYSKNLLFSQFGITERSNSILTFYCGNHAVSASTL